MSFSTCSSFSINDRTLGSIPSPSHGVWPASSAASIYAGASGSGSHVPLHQRTGQLGIGGPGCRDGSECARHRGYSKIWRESPGTPGEGIPVRDPWGRYFKTIEDLRAHSFANSVDSAHIILQIDNVCLGADDFRSKTEIEAHEEQLLFMKKNVEEEVNGLQNQTANSGLTVGLEAPNSQDLGNSMTDIWAQSDKLAQKNKERPDKLTWTHEKPAGQLGEQPEGGGGALCHAHGTAQRDLLHLEPELAQTLAEGQGQAQEYQVLLNIKVRLEAEIAT
ncbi:keratin, type I cytoskeletal 18-like [Glossophaga mutica]